MADRARRGRRRGGSRHPRRRVRRPLLDPRGAVGRRGGDRRRLCRPGALGRLVLRHGGRADPPRRWRDRPRAGRRAAASGREAEAGRDVSWQAVTFVMLAAVLIGGFAWYERSRPPARLVALVAALAALAVAGRL